MKSSNTTWILMLTDKVTPQSIFFLADKTHLGIVYSILMGKFPLLYWSQVQDLTCKSKSSRGNSKLQIVFVSLQSTVNFKLYFVSYFVSVFDFFLSYHVRGTFYYKKKDPISDGSCKAQMLFPGTVQSPLHHAVTFQYQPMSRC